MILLNKFTSFLLLFCCRASLLALVPKAETLILEQPAYPRVNVLLRFSLPLQRLTTQFKFSKKWIPRFYVMKCGSSGVCLYYSDGDNGHPASREGTLSFVRSNPSPSRRHCLRLAGDSTFCFAFLAVTRMHRLQCHVLQRTRRRAGVRVRDQVPSRG